MFTLSSSLCLSWRLSYSLSGASALLAGFDEKLM